MSGGADEFSVIGSTIDPTGVCTCEASECAAGPPLGSGPACLPATEELQPSVRKPVRLLVVDDNPEVADSLAMLMESFDAEVRVAYDGASGIEAAADFRPDITFIDIRMPGMDGYETARRMRARLGDAPILIALTGLGQDREREQTLEAGFNSHLTKPVSADTLETLVRRAAAG
jgi:CheY-like chemotaxis protein